MSDLHQRNFAALAEAIKDIRVINSEQAEKIAKLEEQICKTNLSLDEARQEIRIIKAINSGHGPTG